VAVKVSRESPRDSSRHPLADEFEAWSRLRHPNVVRAYEIARARRGPLPPGTPYLVLESFEGRPSHRSLPPGTSSADLLEALARRVLRALDHVHAAGLVHRDLKPANVLADGRGRFAQVSSTISDRGRDGSGKRGG
jgi:serine/threonine protein kinase